MNDKLIDCVEYELASSWLPSFVTWGWLQDKLADHYIRKARRNLDAVQQFRHIRTLRANGATKGHVMWAIRKYRTSKQHGGLKP